MIKNIVFDVGQVLMSYTPENYLKNLGFSDPLTAPAITPLTMCFWQMR